MNGAIVIPLIFFFFAISFMTLDANSVAASSARVMASILIYDLVTWGLDYIGPDVNMVFF